SRPSRASHSLDSSTSVGRTDRWMVVHLNELTESDFDLLKGSTTKFSIVHCPRSHAYFGHSPFQFHKLRKAGLTICLGTDSLASNDDLSLFAEMRAFQKEFPKLPPDEIFRMVTLNPALALGTPHVVIADIKMETMTGFDVLRHVREQHRQTAVILITAYGTVETAVEAMKMGAYDYVTKPFKIDELQLTVQRALDYQAALRENVYLRKELKNRYKFENIIGTSGKMQTVYNLISKIADTDSTVLIMGESGTGKELVARGLHFNSNRQHHPFVAINCSALPENLLESELFGHKKGSFT